ncbi:MAG: hypothetical protein KDC38_10505 [Planctomycetes bacterium]|nr:hypothetical protein [Planctomycetota bacterium]
MKIIGRVALFAAIVVAGTGHLGWATGGLRRELLIVHLALAPVFLIALIFVGWSWATRPLSPLARACSWSILASAIIGTVTMLLAMNSHFGQDRLHDLIDLHRGSGLALVVAGTLFLLVTARSRAKRPTTPMAPSSKETNS